MKTFSVLVTEKHLFRVEVKADNPAEAYRLAGVEVRDKTAAARLQSVVVVPMGHSILDQKAVDGK